MNIYYRKCLAVSLLCCDLLNYHEVILFDGDHVILAAAVIVYSWYGFVTGPLVIKIVLELMFTNWKIHQSYKNFLQLFSQLFGIFSQAEKDPQTYASLADPGKHSKEYIEEIEKIVKEIKIPLLFAQYCQ